MEHILISGFADEISPDFDEQLRVVTSLGMEYISLRTADGKGIADYTAEEVEEKLLPRLREANVKVSSLGSPIGKINVDDEEAFEKQLVQMEELCKICKVLDCKYIRMFSFFIPEGKNADDYKEIVIEKLKKFDAIAAKYSVVMIHENEKDIYGDIKERCKIILDALGSPHFKSVFDFANFVQCGEDTMECWELLRDHVAYIHIKDAVTTDKENVLCGTGEGKIAEILKRAIKEEGYQGFLTLEPHLVLFDALGSPHFKSVFDFANFVQCGEDTMECWELLRDHVAYIHIKDAVTTDKENVLCGTGEGKIAEILKRAIKEEGYQGFLTLEPHLVLFDALQSLETENAENIIKENKAKDGAEGYSMQYHALIDILDSIEKSN